MKKLLAVAFALSLLGATLSSAQAQGTSGSTDKGAHYNKKNGHAVAHPQYHKKHQPRHNKGKKH